MAEETITLDEYTDKKRQLDTDLKYGVITKEDHDIKLKELGEQRSNLIKGIEKQITLPEEERKAIEESRGPLARYITGMPQKEEVKYTPPPTVKEAISKPIAEPPKKEEAPLPKEKSAPTPAKEKPVSLDTDYQAALEKVRSKYDMEKQALDKEYKERMNRSEWAEVATTIGQALVQYGAARQGLKSGVNLSNIDMQKIDWEKPRSRFAEEYLTKLKMLQEQKNEESRSIENVYLKKMDSKEREGRSGLSPYEAGMLEEKKLSREEGARKAKSSLAEKQIEHLNDVMNDKETSVDKKAAQLGLLESSKDKRSFLNPMRLIKGDEYVSEDKLNAAISAEIKRLKGVVGSGEGEVTTDSGGDKRSVLERVIKSK